MAQNYYMKSDHFDAAIYDCLVICKEHFPITVNGATIGIDDDDVMPLFASDEMDYYPVCDVCGVVHEYVNLIDYGRENN